jgi:hypothetical protein
MREAAGGRDAGPEEQAHQTDGRAQSHARAGPRGQVLTPVAFQWRDAIYIQRQQIKSLHPLSM